ncbi:MAG: peptide chain release factor N(5)-glutamine methyltransferase [Pseudomonadota bacterium]
MTPLTPRSTALREAASVLAEAGVPEPRRDATVLLRWAADISAATLAAEPDALLGEPGAKRFAQAVDARAKRQPVSHIIGRRAFYGRDFLVTGDVLDPRPESEILVDAVLQSVPDDAAAQVLDLGVGSGCLVLSVLAERPLATGLGVDRSEAALAVAQANAAQFGLAERLRLRAGDWLEGIDGRFDVIMCNPPYISEAEFAGLEPEVRLWEPKCALTPARPTDAPDDGLAVYHRLAPRISAALTSKGVAFFEVGFGQARAVADLIAAEGLEASVLNDLGGAPRVVRAAPPQDSVKTSV